VPILTRIFIVDDHDQFRKQLRSLIESRGDWQVCCEAADGNEAVIKHGPANPNVTIMDFHMPGLDGLRASRRILADNPGAAILMITVFASEQLAEQAKRAGIKGFCSKNKASSIVSAIEALLRGETYFLQAIH
jgi:DNA-binding NarL/FixJ family response regulator